MRRLVWAAGVLFVIGLLVVAGCQEETRPGKPVVSQAAPEIEGEDQDGKPMKLSDYRGKVVLIDFWASWCPTCMELIPDDKEIAAEMKGRPFVLLGVNGDESPEVLKATVKDLEIPWRNWFDGRPPDGHIARQWRIRGWPSMYLIDHKGILRYEHRVDRDPTERLERKIRQLVKEAEADGAQAG
jgi:thiol-disulfide isomerase/thioredoxin